MPRNDTLVRLADALDATDEIAVTLREDARMAPRTETRTRTERDSRVVPTGTGVTTETVEREVEETVVVGERKVVDDRWLDVEVESRAAVCELAAIVGNHGLSTEESVTATDVSDTGEHTYEVRA